MKSILFALFLLIAPTSYANEIVIEVPQECTMDVQLASFVLQYYDKGIPREEFEQFVEEMATKPDAIPEMVDITRKLIDLVYSFEPKTREDFVAVYRLVLKRCVAANPPGMPV